MKRSKAYRASAEKTEALKVYSVEEAVKILKSQPKLKFDATVEVHYNLGIDPRHADQQIRTTTSLPHGTGKTVRVVAFCEEELVKKAKAAGAVEAGGEELIEKVVQKGWSDFEVAVATPGMMKLLAKAARILGPKGLMPNPKSGTVGTDVEKMVKEVVAGRMEFRNDKFGIVHSVIGKISFKEDQLVENFKALHKAIMDAKPTGAKGGNYLKSVYICSTMSPSLQVGV